MAKYPPLPSPSPRTADETLLVYGARLLTFVLVTGVTATLADADLELTEYAATRALSTTVTIGPPEAREASPAIVYDHIEAVRRQVCAAMRSRQADAGVPPEVPQPQPQTVPPRDGASKVPRPDVPYSRPPAGTYATVDVAF